MFTSEIYTSFRNNHFLQSLKERIVGITVHQNFNLQQQPGTPTTFYAGILGRKKKCLHIQNLLSAKIVAPNSTFYTRNMFE